MSNIKNKINFFESLNSNKTIGKSNIKKTNKLESKISFWNNVEKDTIIKTQNVTNKTEHMINKTENMINKTENITKKNTKSHINSTEYLDDDLDIINNIIN
tara:strand:+ start:156 stop:458 length:303 start_codon:yes stop_codon:yes gene_type:complete